MFQDEVYCSCGWSGDLMDLMTMDSRRVCPCCRDDGELYLTADIDFGAGIDDETEKPDMTHLEPYIGELDGAFTMS